MTAALVALAVALLATTYAAGAQSPTAPLAAQALTGHGGPVRAMTVLADGTLVTGGFDSAIVVWDAARGTARRVLRFHEGAVVALVALKGDCFASGGEDARISLWCGDTPSPTRVLIGHTAPVASFAVSPDGRTLASTSWDIGLEFADGQREWLTRIYGGADRVARVFSESTKLPVVRV